MADHSRSDHSRFDHSRSDVRSPDSTDPTPEVTPNLAPYIKLDQFLKVVGVAATGGQAKLLIQEGYVEVNGVVETRRGRKLRTGDRVSLDDEGWEVQL